MIVYFDTSALVPLLVAEPGTERARQIWETADRVIASRLIYVEAAAALAQAHRMKRLSDLSHRAARRSLDTLYADLDLIEVVAPLVRRAADLAHRCGLRGYDALHCASAEAIADSETVVASGDRSVLRTCSTLGMATVDTSVS